MSHAKPENEPRLHQKRDSAGFALTLQGSR